MCCSVFKNNNVIQKPFMHNKDYWVTDLIFKASTKLSLTKQTNHFTTFTMSSTLQSSAGNCVCGDLLAERKLLGIYLKYKSKLDKWIMWQKWQVLQTKKPKRYWLVTLQKDSVF